MKSSIKKLTSDLLEKTISSKIIQAILASKKSSSKKIMAVGSLLLLLTFVLPLWNIQLEAPQYRTPLGMNIYINKIVDEAPHDIQNINILNHYVGMAKIPEHMPEFDIFPYVIIAMSILGFALALLGKHQLFLTWFIVMVTLGTAGLYDFYLWEHEYGHNLDKNAILKFTDKDGSPMGFQPPVFGSKHILNFVAHSYPGLGALSVFLSMGFSFIAFLLGKAALKEKITPKDKVLSDTI